ncbi:hypothetical protein Lal_00024996 [Lupinus albus]|nr:hypothetical protein Lal_00024996 [Lupinus albus]
MQTNGEMKAKIKRERESEEHSVTADEKQTCRQWQSQIVLFITLHKVAIDIMQRKRVRQR